MMVRRRLIYDTHIRTATGRNNLLLVRNIYKTHTIALFSCRMLHLGNMA